MTRWTFSIAPLLALAMPAAAQVPSEPAIPSAASPPVDAAPTATTPAPLQTVQPIDDMSLAQAAAARGDPAEALSRYLRVLAAHPDDPRALAGAGQAALAVGDLNAASGFFGRAEARAPGNGAVKAGIASMLARQGDARGSLRYFRQAAALGVPEASLAADRGLAYDLRGDNRRAQAEYRLALIAHPGDAGVIKRLALSLAIGGEPGAALLLLDPLLRKQDVSAWRSRMFARAVAGDIAGANADASLVLNTQQAALLAPYLAKLAALKPAEKAAAVFLGRFPSARPTAATFATAGPALAAPPTFATPPAPAPIAAEAAPTPPPAALVDLGPPTPSSAAPAHPLTRRERLAQARADAQDKRKRGTQDKAAKAARLAARNPKRYWAQIAGGANQRDLPKAWAALKAKHGAELAGRSPFTMHYRYTNRLLIGPFASSQAAQAWVNEKRTKGMATFMVTTDPGTEVDPVG